MLRNQPSSNIIVLVKIPKVGESGAMLKNEEGDVTLMPPVDTLSSPVPLYPK